jgi:tetratricopeptide (TPR) repeat protein
MLRLADSPKIGRVSAAGIMRTLQIGKKLTLCQNSFLNGDAMGLIALECAKCSASLKVDSESSTYTCRYCNTVHERDYSKGASPTPQSLRIMAERAIANAEFGKALQFVEQGLAIDPHHFALQALEVKARDGLGSLAKTQISQTADAMKAINIRGEAEQYKIQAEFVLHALQANMKVYKSNSSLSGADPANIDLGLQYINRSLKLVPDDPVYLNLKALLLLEGKGDKERAAVLLEKAAELAPDDINIQNNLKAAKASGCFIATAAYGTPLALEIGVLRNWRDQRLLLSPWGKRFVTGYYRMSPPVADFISTRPALKYLTRGVLTPLVKLLSHKHSRD